MIEQVFPFKSDAYLASWLPSWLFSTNRIRQAVAQPDMCESSLLPQTLIKGFKQYFLLKFMRRIKDLLESKNFVPRISCKNFALWTHNISYLRKWEKYSELHKLYGLHGGTPPFIVWSGKRAMIWPGVKWTAKTFCGCYSEHKRSRWSFRQTETRKHSLPLLCFIHRMIEKTVFPTSLNSGPRSNLQHGLDFDYYILHMLP